MYADRKRWRYEMVSHSSSSVEATKKSYFKGQDVYKMMKYESGTHRVCEYHKLSRKVEYISTVTVVICLRLQRWLMWISILRI